MAQFVSPHSHVSWTASVLWSNWMGKISPTSFITRCLKEWMYEDVSVTAHMSCPHSFASEVFRSTVQGNTDMYVSSCSKNSSDIPIYYYPIITLQQVVVTLQYWTPFSVQTFDRDLFWVTVGPRTIIDGKLQTVLLQGSLMPPNVAMGRWQFAKWQSYGLIWKILFLSILATEL